MKLSESGAANPLAIASTILGLLVILLAGTSVWAYMGYYHQKNDTDQLIQSAVDKAKTDQKAADDETFAEQEKSPTKQYHAPTDLGSVSFSFPKTWSVYVAKEVGSLDVYMHPIKVVSPSRDNRYALHVTVEDRAYTDVLKSFESRVSQQELKSSPLITSEFTGIKFEGALAKDREGSVAVFKIRDKTLVLTSDFADSKADFDTIVLKSLTFKP